jgi:hypothetical protein
MLIQLLILQGQDHLDNMNRTLKRPMFRIGGSAGTGITSGLDQPRKQYQQGSMPTFQASGLPGFLTSFGLNLLATPPQGNIFQTAGIAAREPFNQLQTSQARSRELQGERDFLKGETDRKIEASAAETDKLIASREKIAFGADADENVMAYAEIFRDSATNAPNLIKGRNAVKFFETEYNRLVEEQGVESVAVEPIDATTVRTKQQINTFKKANPDYIGKIYYDVASGQAVKFKRNSETGDIELVPITGVVDKEGDDMPAPNNNAGLFGQKTKPDVITPAVKEFLEDKDRPDFGIGFYDQ